MIIVIGTNLSKPANKVCLVYDERMLNHCDESDNTHPERPVRISHIMNKLKENSLLERCHLKAVSIQITNGNMSFESRRYTNYFD